MAKPKTGEVIDAKKAEKRIKQGNLLKAVGLNSTQFKLEEELKRIKGMLNTGHELKVVWSPSFDSKLSGEVKDKVVYIYESREDKALEAVRHEFIDYLVSQAIEPYKCIANKLIQLLNEIAYKKKEEIVENLAKLLSTRF
jgi:hypothetical protein